MLPFFVYLLELPGQWNRLIFGAKFWVRPHLRKLWAWYHRNVTPPDTNSRVLIINPPGQLIWIRARALGLSPRFGGYISALGKATHWHLSGPGLLFATLFFLSQPRAGILRRRPPPLSRSRPIVSVRPINQRRGRHTCEDSRRSQPPFPPLIFIGCVSINWT